jgi:hypothetical protein
MPGRCVRETGAFMSAYEPTWQDDLASPPALPLEAVVLGSVGWGVLIFYMTAQVLLSFTLTEARWLELKLSLETYLLLLGLILHVQWRRVERLVWEAGLPCPWWLTSGDCLSFVTTFWACGILLYWMIA